MAIALRSHTWRVRPSGAIAPAPTKDHGLAYTLAFVAGERVGDEEPTLLNIGVDVTEGRTERRYILSMDRVAALQLRDQITKIFED